MNDRQAEKMDIVDYLLITIGIVFLLQTFIEELTPLFYFDPYLALQQPWRFLTSIFLHANLTHLFFNAYALYLFGKPVVREIGEKEFLKIFILTGLSGSIGYYITFLLGLTTNPALGASGAIFGIMGVASMLFPNSKIIMFPVFFPVSLRTASVIWIVIEFLGVFNPSSGIASAAHLGGLFLGLYYGKKIKEEMAKPYWWEIEY